ncbi:MAG TPA: ABC transporter ATP-binding protein [Desulfosarcina sp.]|nr:ABC transporter ATP-binding protein [Desulfosarcina sp.]
MLKIAGVDVYRGETQVLWDIALEVKDGERVAILGSNGAGKSSLMAAITGVLAPRRGDIQFRGQSLAGFKPYQITQLGIALVPEGRRVYKDMSVRENLEIGAFPKRGRPKLKLSMDRVLALFPKLQERRHQRAGTLSGGEQQMLAIGRALMSLPELLLIDELSLGLAPRVTKEIYAALDNLGHETTVLMVEQNVELALKHSRRAYIVESGRLTRSGASADLMDDPDIRRAYLGL